MNKYIKKGIAAVITFVFTACQPVLAAFPDVGENAEYAQAVESMAQRGYLKGDAHGNFNPNTAINRAEYVTLMCRFLGIDGLAAKKEVNNFSDLSAEHWANGYVALLMEKSIVSGFDDGTFRPAAHVTQEQALKMLICCLGMKEDAEKLGSYPEGYIAFAKEIGITHSAEVGKELVRSDAAMYVFNAVEIRTAMLEQAEEEQLERKLVEEYEGLDEIVTEEEENENITAEETEQVAEEESMEKEEEEEEPNYSLDLKQEESDTCTASSMTMLLRRIYNNLGEEYVHITEKKLKKDKNVWLEGVGLYGIVQYEDYRIIKINLSDEMDKWAYFERKIEEHKEGIIIYDADKPHAVLLTHMEDGVFYASDPATGKNTALEGIGTISGKTQEEKIMEIDSIWILEK